jgi:hypothetical protein
LLNPDPLLLSSPTPMLGGGVVPPPHFEYDVVDFNRLVESLGKSVAKTNQLWFVKKLDHIPKVNLPQVLAHSKALSFAEKGLVS